MQVVSKRFRRLFLWVSLLILVLAPGAWSAPWPAHEKAFLAEYESFPRTGGTAEVHARLARMARDAGVETLADRKTECLTLVALALQASGMAEAVCSVPESALPSLKGAAPEDARNLLLAQHLGLIDNAKALVKARTLFKDQAMHLLYRTLVLAGKGPRALGWSDDPDISGKLCAAWETFHIFSGIGLSDIGVSAVAKGVSTGYNIKSDVYSARFVSPFTLRYGHSDLRHARQILALLTANGITARVGLEPKTSSYRYLLEWGPVPEPSQYYRVDKVRDDLYLASALEYDLMLEFKNEAEKNAFDKLILAHAKKDDSNPDGKGLLWESWWQPLYSSDAPMGRGYSETVKNVVSLKGDDGFRLVSFVLKEKEEEFKKAFTSLSRNIEIRSAPLWCNDAFCRYLKGEHQ